MKKNIRRIAVLLGITIALSGLAGCAAESPDTDSASKTEPASSSAAQTADAGSAWEDASATFITLNGADISVDGTGAAASGGVVTITRAGTYVVSGTLADGQLAVAATAKDEVLLVLNGADITNLTGAPIYASQCDKLTVTLADGTENTLTDGASGFQYINAADEEPNSALFCKDDLTINGGGALIVNAGFNNGIGSKDDLLISGGSLVVNAVNHGLRGNDSVTVTGGSLTITAGNDGIQTNNTEDSTKGWILVEGGELTIVSGHDAIQADTTLTIADGGFTITAGGGTSGGQTASADTTSDSFKGLKATGDIRIAKGSFAIDSYDDAIHANGSIHVDGGEFLLAAGDDGIHADGDLTVGAGNVKITTSFEGLEAANITITGGTADITSSDDGLNAAGGSDQAVGGGRFGGDSFAAGGNYSINISGGKIAVAAGGDGIDSNGSININGGEIVSLINSTADNGAIDGDGAFILTGGTVIYGGTGTGGSPSEGSTQSYVYVGAGVSSGSKLTVKKDGETLLTFTPPADCRALALSSPDIVSGQSYEVYSGESLLSAVTAGTGGGGMGGRKMGQGGPGGQPPGEPIA